MKDRYRYALGAVVGVLLWLIFAPEPPVVYDTVVVTREQIVEREVPARPPTTVERVRYVYLQPTQRATAPNAVVSDVQRFCRPVVVADTVRVPAPFVIRSVVQTPSWVPLRKDGLLVTSMNGYGDLVAEDYMVRPGFSMAAGLQPPFNTTVRYSRFAPFREITEGVLWYAGFRVLEGIIRLR